MTLTCNVNQSRGVATLTGSDIPNGPATLTRTQPGLPYVLRGGEFTVATSGFVKDDSEAPFGVPLRYDLLSEPTDRLIQRNLILTPNAVNGQGTWAALGGRTLSVVAAPVGDTGHSPAYVNVNASSGTPDSSVAPHVIGHVNGTPLAAGGPDVLTPTTGGGTGILTGDWVYLVHHQANTDSIGPFTQTGFTKVFEDNQVQGLGLSIWRRKRVGGDSSYTVNNPSGSACYNTLFWVRGARDDVPMIDDTIHTWGGVESSITAEPLNFAHASVQLSIFAGETTDFATAPDAADMTGSPFGWSVSSGTYPRSTTIGVAERDAGFSSPVTLQFHQMLKGAIAVQMAILAPVTVGSTRYIAEVQTGGLPVSGGPYLLTGRFRFTSPEIWLWQDVKDQGTWQHLKDTKANWGAVRSAVTMVTTDYLRLFVEVTNAAGTVTYIQPVQVMRADTPTAGSWIDFSFFFTPAVDIPSGSKIRLMHGTATREYAVSWKFDEFGITAGPERAAHNTLYWFDGDTAVPANPEDYLLPDGSWDDASGDASISWSGTPGNSISVFTGPSKVAAFTTCQIDAPSGYCEPVHLGDPVSPVRSQWFSLMAIGELGYSARMNLFTVLSRAGAVAVSDVRGLASGSISLMTRTLEERNMALMVFETGRILLLRNPNPDYPETDWYLAIGDVKESRLGPNHRRPERLWELEFARVDRPSGLIDNVQATTWQDVKDDYADWAEVRSENGDWLALLTSRSGGGL